MDNQIPMNWSYYSINAELTFVTILNYASMKPNVGRDSEPDSSHSGSSQKLPTVAEWLRSLCTDSWKWRHSPSWKRCGIWNPLHRSISVSSSGRIFDFVSWHAFLTRKGSNDFNFYFPVLSFLWCFYAACLICHNKTKLLSVWLLADLGTL